MAKLEVDETGTAFWKRMRNYDSLYCHIYHCKNSKTHPYVCSNCIYWTAYDFEDGNLTEQEEKSVQGYNCVNFKYETKDLLITVCARQKRRNGIKIDMFVDILDYDRVKYEPCVVLEDYSVMEYIMSRPLEAIQKNRNGMYQRSLISRPLSLKEANLILKS